ncbi:hypothetical protein BSPLISOX_754 [uncultured Gammaproteobacteria bacterium]|jgi:hypothetical protein|nr:hypothetical protein [uncultured Gammaproteobacteria bacterium]VVH67280.1 hypothetical protein BSPLISOX_754 [uncultured Gammaproteobacteria bacterium]
MLELCGGDINLDRNPELIQPPKVDDNIVYIKLVPDINDIISPDIIDVALSYSIAGIKVVLEIPFEIRAEFENQHLASIISNGGWSLSLLPPNEKSKALWSEYCKEVIDWYQLWRSPIMRNFEQTIYPITPYCEYLATSYLIDKNKKDLTSDDIKTLKDLSANPSDSYLLHFINNMQTVVVTEFKRKLKDFIKKEDANFYQDIELCMMKAAE